MIRKGGCPFFCPYRNLWRAEHDEARAWRLLGIDRFGSDQLPREDGGSNLSGIDLTSRSLDLFHCCASISRCA